MKGPEKSPNFPLLTESCKHHWKIEEANGPISKGQCIKPACGATREFRNWLPETDFVTNTEHRFAT